MSAQPPIARPMQGRKLHFIAIGGAGMSGLALVAHQLGAIVTGSDRSESSYLERLRAAGLDPGIGHEADRVPADAEVVISTAIGEDNPELAVARKRGQPVLHRSDLLSELCAGHRVLAVAGTHGKTTTAAICIHVLRQIGASPTFFLGGELPGAGSAGVPANAGLGDGEWLVVEADESDGSFLKLDPEIAVITNFELDHHVRWGSLAELGEAFEQYAAGSETVVAGRAPVAPGPGPGRRVVRFAIEAADDAPREALGSGEEAFLATAVSASGGGSRFKAGFAGAAAQEVELGVPGRHNVANATAALAALACAGFDPALCAGAVAGFGGVARRMELKGERSGARIYDDYAHHPTEVAAALEAARELEPRRLIAVFQPHLYSRTKAMAREFGAALAAADEVAVLEVYPAREQPIGELEGVTGRWVAEAAADYGRGSTTWWFPDAEQAAAALAPRLTEGDVLITIGAGDIFRLAETLVAP